MFDTINLMLKAKKTIILIWCWLVYLENLTTNQKEKELINNKNIIKISWKQLWTLKLDQIIKSISSDKIDEFEFPISPRAYTNSLYKYEYLKIAEWCNNSCSFCIIPDIRWPQKSLKIEDIIIEIRNMVNNWIEEVILIAQDTTRYWVDLYKKPYLFELLNEIEKIDLDFKYRLLYLYPDVVTLKQLEKLTKFEKFIPYFDIPLQHISTKVLKNMKRFYNKDYILKFLDFIKQNFTESYIRTNIIIWFPWEDENDFKELVEFLINYKFDNIALFEYHDEPLAQSSKLPNQLDYNLIHQRFLIIKNMIDKQNSNKLIWKTKETYWYVMNIIWKKIIVRNRLKAPEIDPYDEIKLTDITWVYNDTWVLDIWDKIIYIK